MADDAPAVEEATPEPELEPEPEAEPEVKSKKKGKKGKKVGDFAVRGKHHGALPLARRGRAAAIVFASFLSAFSASACVCVVCLFFWRCIDSCHPATAASVFALDVPAS